MSRNSTAQKTLWNGSKGRCILQVQITPKFEEYLKENFNDEDLEVIGQFVYHVEHYGLEGLQGRNKKSDDIDTNDPNWLTKVRFVNQYNLWHYHIGINETWYGYQESPKGDFTSEYVIHYMKEKDRIVLVYMSSHPPFKLPPKDYLQFI